MNQTSLSLSTEQKSLFPVYVLLISHKHGSDLRVFHTQEKAKQALVEYCQEWWDEELFDEDINKLTDDQIIEKYFEDFHEYYEITKTHVE